MSDTAPAAINEKMEKHFFRASAEDFKKIPGSPIAYWVSKQVSKSFEKDSPLGRILDIRAGMSTTDNQLFLRQWFEVNWSHIAISCNSKEAAIEINCKWFPYIKGGPFRRWFGNNDFVVNWKNDGEDIKKYIAERPEKQVGGRLVNMDCFFKQCLAWTRISSGNFSSRFYPPGCIFSDASNGGFGKSENIQRAILLLNTKIISQVLAVISPTLNFYAGDIGKIPAKISFGHMEIFEKLLVSSRGDWNSYETSWDFTTLPLLHPDHHHPTLEQTYANLRVQWHDTTLEMQQLEEENNRIFIKAYGLQDELTPDVPMEEITLTCNPRYRYGKGKIDEDYETLLRCDTVKELISYAVGCMMGRYSLDEPGLVYAHSGNQGFDPDIYQTFPADEDGILPVMDLDWFDDDVTRRLSAFIQYVWPETHLDDNLAFIADCLAPRAAESPLDTIRRYLSTTFFKDHMRTYKKRPIYWLFSSGRQKAFTCLVYLHRYHPATLSRMRSHYVTPLQGKLAARMEFLDHERQAAGTPSAQKKIQTQMDLLKKKQAELNTFDDELRHYADLKIDLDLDDGVKVNYAKFGNLLAERKAITGE
jgi:type II restriction/modification system DNA methylase subunit YeeA